MSKRERTKERAMQNASLSLKYKKSTLMETIDEAMDKRMSKSLLHFMKLVDPEKRFAFDDLLIKTWNRLSLKEQRKLYLYLLYRKWRGLDVYGEPYYVIMNCHPVPFNWSGTPDVETLIKQKKMVIAKYNGSFGTYTKDEARIYEMTDVKPLI